MLIFASTKAPRDERAEARRADKPNPCIYIRMCMQLYEYVSVHMMRTRIQYIPAHVWRLPFTRSVATLPWKRELLCILTSYIERAVLQAHDDDAALRRHRAALNNDPPPAARALVSLYTQTHVYIYVHRRNRGWAARTREQRRSGKRLDKARGGYVHLSLPLCALRAGAHNAKALMFYRVLLVARCVWVAFG